jgi:hypothetical protein
VAYSFTLQPIKTNCSQEKRAIKTWLNLYFLKLEFTFQRTIQMPPFPLIKLSKVKAPIPPPPSPKELFGSRLLNILPVFNSRLEICGNIAKQKTRDKQ